MPNTRRFRRRPPSSPEIMANALQDSFRERIAGAISGNNATGDTIHQIATDFGYPDTLTFDLLWNMYRRFGIAKAVCKLPVDTTWMNAPEVGGIEGADWSDLTTRLQLWQRLRGLDLRQRVGRYAGLFMRVRDGKQPSEPLDTRLSGSGALVQMVPLFEGQLEVLSTDTDPTSDDYGLPTMYQYSSGRAGNRNEDVKASFSLHPSRVIIAAEGADTGGIHGVPALEAAYNSLMDLRKIIGSGGEGFYRQAMQSLVFSLKDPASAQDNRELLERFNDNANDFARNRARRALWTPGMDVSVLSAALADPKEHFAAALNDVAASSGIPATILIGQQTGRLASAEDSRTFLAGINARREDFASQMVRAVIDWCMRTGILPSRQYEIQWDDLLALGDSEKLDLADKMAAVNEKQFRSGGQAVFTAEQIAEAAGYELEAEPDDLTGEGVEDEEPGDDG